MSVLNPTGLPESWALAPLGDLGSWAGGGTPSKSEPAYWSGGSVPWVSSKDMKSFSILDAEDHITEAAVRESSTTKVPTGTVLMVTRSGILRHTFPVAVSRLPVAINQDVKALKPSAELVPDFIAYALLCFGQRILQLYCKDGTTVQSIELPGLKSFRIPLAPRNEQRRITDALDELLSDLDAGIAALARIKAKLVLYRASVLKAAVEGTLTAEWRKQHPHTEPASELLKRILAERRRRWEEQQLHKFKEKRQEPAGNWRAGYNAPPPPNIDGHPPLPPTWCWARAEQLCGFITKGTTPPGAEAPQPVGDVPFIKVQHLSASGEFCFSDSPSFVSRLIHNSFLVRSRVLPGDVLDEYCGAASRPSLYCPRHFTGVEYQSSDRHI